MNRRWAEQRLLDIWYGRSRLFIALLPLSGCYRALSYLRRLAYRFGWLRSVRLHSKVIVVGNITVGGTGKTPLVIALAQRLQRAGFKAGILTRGYRGRAQHWPQRVSETSDPQALGDEAVLLARKTRAPVFAGPDRARAGRSLLQAVPCDVVICDDGLQHYALQRDLEIALVDASRGSGNGHCLPAGPLREPAARLRQVDAVVSLGGGSGTGYTMHLTPGPAYRISDPAQTRRLVSFQGDVIHAVAGIGHPERFFDMLRGVGLRIQPHRFSDHHPYNPSDLAFGNDNPVLMTEKDALKCELFAPAHWWAVPVEAVLERSFEQWLLAQLEN